ncbi:MAG: sulfurtransferase [Deltaproteobacteria bacterium]|nr:sulfurtransferase [Deltaproteobacteria bacterium]
MKKHSPGFEKLCDEARSRVEEIGVAEASREARTPGVLLVDVREESEWAAGRAVGAIHLSKGIIERDVEERIPDRDARILCYCGGGYRSALVAENLARMGYRRVASVAGGWRAWQEAGLPVTKG